MADPYPFAVTDNQVVLRRAVPDDAELLARLVAHPEVEPFIAPYTERDPAVIRERIAAGDDAGHVLIAELEGRAVGTLAFSTRSANSRIANITGVMVDPAVRGRGVGVAALRAVVDLLIDEHGFHRLELETYGFNTAAQSLFERCGFAREGVRRRAYWRFDRWNDGVQYALLADER